MSSTENDNAVPARLYPEKDGVRAHLLEGQTGLELETQRISRNGHLALTPHPFEEEPHIDRDFGEAQIEINTPPAPGLDEVRDMLHEQLRIAHTRLQEDGELLWPFSNPPAIADDSEIRIAEYKGDLQKKTVYRRYLAAKYGKRKMTLCGIHFNYSFSEELLRQSFACSGQPDFRTYCDMLYLQLAEKALAYSWVVVALLAASPLTDSSFSPGRREGRTVLTKYASLRCSEEGYWNLFEPVLSYEDIASYTESIAQYRDKGLLRHEGELYYPVRIKPAGKYSLRNLCEGGVDHIELRMVDLNPLDPDGIDPEDLRFLQLLLIWLASGERIPLGSEGQKRAVRNQKAAALYDWSQAAIDLGEGGKQPLQQALESVLGDMHDFFRDSDPVCLQALRHQEEKLRDPEKRYVRQVSQLYGKQYLTDGLKRSEQLRREFLAEK